jgi:hypothetical protein
MRQRVSRHADGERLARFPARDTITAQRTRLEEDDMRRMVAVAAVAVVPAAGVAVAQQPPAQPGPTPGHQHMQGGMCPMMGGGMMGMMGGQSDSPRTMQMRGEMMKAMGDIMIKYGKAMEGAR